MTQYRSMMSRANLRTVFALGCAAWACSWSPTTAARSADTQLTVANPAERTRANVAELRASLKLPALQVAVAKTGKVVAAENAGFADVERRIPITTASRFRIGSVSKLLTATATVRLHEAGILDLDAPIGRYLRNLPADKAAVTARQLAGHLAGFGHYGRNDYINRTAYRDVSESLPRILIEPLVVAPGSRYVYSSYGFNVLGAVLQSAAGKPFPDVIAEQVSRPLGMAHTSVEPSADASPERVRLYSGSPDGRFADAPAADLTDRWPSGGFVSTAEDLARFADGLLNTSFLPTRAREVLFVSQRSADGQATGVGLGWRTARDPQGRRFVHHGGETVGGRAFVLLYPDQGVSVVLLTNLTFAALGETQALDLAGPWLAQ
jgi:CubicO group peptidase (beta-lactamase class C family)